MLSLAIFINYKSKQLNRTKIILFWDLQSRTEFKVFNQIVYQIIKVFKMYEQIEMDQKLKEDEKILALYSI